METFVFENSLMFSFKRLVLAELLVKFLLRREKLTKMLALPCFQISAQQLVYSIHCQEQSLGQVNNLIMAVLFSIIVLKLMLSFWIKLS